MAELATQNAPSHLPEDGLLLHGQELDEEASEDARLLLLLLAAHLPKDVGQNRARACVC